MAAGIRVCAGKRAYQLVHPAFAVALGTPPWSGVQVTLDSHSDNTLEKFGETLASIPEVIEAHLVSGDYDYLLRIVVKDTRDYERLLREKLYKIKGIRQSRSNFVLRTLKKADLPLFSG